MFDIGFWELGLIGVVALLVIGPERLPGVARSAGMWIGRARRFVSSVQADINREISKTEELKRLMEEQVQIKSAHEIIEQTADEVREGLAVPTLKPSERLKAMDEDEADTARPATPASDAAPATRSVAATPAAKAAPAPHEPLKADDAKHDQSA